MNGNGWVRRQVTVKYPVITKDATTQAPVTSWEPLVPAGSPPVGERFWAWVKDTSPAVGVRHAETTKNGLQQWRQQTTVRLRWRDDITNEMELVLHGDGTDTRLRIVGGPADVERKRWIEMQCERYAVEGDG